MSGVRNDEASDATSQSITERPLRALVRDPLAALVGIAILTFALFGIGSSLWGARVFHGADLLFVHAPYRDSAPENFESVRPCVADTVDNVLPASTELRRRALDGDFADWDSYAGGGAPLGSVPNFAALSPLSLPTYVFPPRLAPGYVKLLEILLGAAGMALFLRRLNLTRASAALGGLIFVSTGFMVTWTNWPQTRTATCIPWVFWAVERFVQRRTLRSAVPIAVAIAAMLFGGFPSVAGYTLYAVVPYLAVRTFMTSTRSAATRRTAAGLGFIGAGVALASVQLLPFVAQLTSLDLQRAQRPSFKLPIASLVTMFAPAAYGKCGYGYFGPGNQIETGAFVGAAALVLVGVAVFRGAAPRVPRGVMGYFVVATGITILLGWVGHFPLEVAQKLPVFSNNPVFRIRSVLGLFLAVLAAIGFDRLQQQPTANGRVRRCIEIAAMALAGVAGLALVWQNHRAYRLVATYRFPDYTLPLVAVLVAASIVAWTLTSRFNTLSPSWRTCVLALLPLLVLVESTSFAREFWPRIRPEQFYPTTPVHQFLIDHSKRGERYMGIGSAMYPGTNVYYGLATPNGHGFTSPTWMDLLKTVDRDVARSVTLTAFTPGLDSKRVASPILDRMAVEYVVTDPRQTIYGTPISASTARDVVVLRSGAVVQAPIASGPLRGVALTVNSTADLVRPAWIRAEIVDASGRVIATNRRRIEADFDHGVLAIALASDTATEIVGTARFSIEGSTGAISLMGSAAVPAVQIVQPEDDHLQLVFAGAANVWRRTGALPRVRWASTAIVVEGARDRVRWLASVAKTNTNAILIEQPQSPTDGLGATIVRSTESGDERRITVDALGSGYLVIADALADGWHATVDGKPAKLLPADHAMVAVRVNKGRHVVALDYSPPRQRFGLAVSLATAIILGCIGFGGYRRKRRRQSLT